MRAIQQLAEYLWHDERLDDDDLIGLFEIQPSLLGFVPWQTLERLGLRAYDWMTMFNNAPIHDSDGDLLAGVPESGMWDTGEIELGELLGHGPWPWDTGVDEQDERPVKPRLARRRRRERRPDLNLAEVGELLRGWVAALQDAAPLPVDLAAGADLVTALEPGLAAGTVDLTRLVRWCISMPEFWGAGPAVTAATAVLLHPDDPVEKYRWVLRNRDVAAAVALRRELDRLLGAVGSLVVSEPGRAGRSVSTGTDVVGAIALALVHCWSHGGQAAPPFVTLPDDTPGCSDPPRWPASSTFEAHLLCAPDLYATTLGGWAIAELLVERVARAEFWPAPDAVTFHGRVRPHSATHGSCFDLRTLTHPARW